MSFVGIDVAKAQLEFAVRPSGETGVVTNDDAGVSALVTRCQRLAPALLVLEATGGSEAAIVAALAAAGLPVVVANPRQVRDFAKATGQLAKTDALDARVLALFAALVCSASSAPVRMKNEGSQPALVRPCPSFDVRLLREAVIPPPDSATDSAHTPPSALPSLP